MKSRIIRLLLLALVSSVLSCHNPTSRVQKQVVTNAGINALFDGKTLTGWEITSFGTEGPVDVSEGEIVLNFGDGCTGITWQNDFPKNNYKLSLEAKKTSGNDFFCGITFPVNDEFCSLIVGGWGGPVVGISCIDGKDASENETRRLKNFEKNKWYKIQLEVNSQSVVAFIDNEKVVDFNYSGHKLYVRPEVELSKPFGICTWNTTAHIRNIELTDLD